MPRTILITGCSSGIGLCAAHTLRQRGWRVFASARQLRDVEKLHADGFDALWLDLDDSQSIHAAIDILLTRTGGRLDALFNNGAWGLPGAVEDLSRDALRAQFETNLFGWVELTNRLIPLMRQQGHGRIVQCSSVLGFAALPYRGAYTASKFALEGLSDTLRMELRGSGIHLSLLEPGPIQTRFRANSYLALTRWIQTTGSVHEAQYQKQLVRLQKEGAAAPFTLPPEAVVTKLIHALESPRPRLRYRVTVPTIAFAWLKRLLPGRWMDVVLLRASGGGKH
ncbi:MAG: SDR family oxidoreductase [Halothiobacillaceae bacterium]|nr:SDR family oxidoreductase [Halothiobacillaceae bacterium]